ncbi:hypothetical protein QBC34DRAFT_159882 [Podospora aff. communis PSN243]|uniref:Chitin-binding type-4 domain-containing protein n=1 Tax=Podospora aff. communis PSN243 TaxID=3040156 RepID=A0AAV9H0Z0_9PEZI|nr:hypothetical protein QBC34DRAFT_159882 [Podospora aff. communis PSN243]
MRASLLTLAALAAATVSAHGNITFPPARLPGPAMLAACGQAAVDTVLSDGTIALEEVIPASPQCNVGLCRGAQFADNRDNIQTFSLGQVVIIEVALTIPHEGPANVSIVSTKTNAIVGGILLFFDTYADEKLQQLPANNTAFGVTLPTGEAGEEVKAACQQPGDCVLQWWWLGTDAKQTYESCIDFVLGDAPAAGVNREAIERQNLVKQGGKGKGAERTGPAGSGDAASPVSNEAAAAVPEAVVDVADAEGSFGGVQGVAVAGEVGVDGAPVEIGADSFGGVVETVPIAVRRSRVSRGMV